MTVTVQTSRVTYAGNGATVTFAVPFYFIEESDLVVILRNTSTGVETPQALTTNYTVSGEGDQAGGSITFLTAPASGVTIDIYRDPPITQLADYTDNSRFPAAGHEKALDRQTMVSQRLADQLDQYLTGDVTSYLTDVQIYPPGPTRKVFQDDFGGYFTGTAARSGEPNVQLVRKTNHTGTRSHTSGVGRLLDAITFVQSVIASNGSPNFETTANFSIYEETAQTSSANPPDLVAGVDTAIRKATAVGSTSSIWARNMVTKDLTGRQSSVSGGVLRGAEINITASGPDNAATRYGLDLILFHETSLPVSTDGATSFYAGIRVIHASAINNALLPSTVTYAFMADGDDRGARVPAVGTSIGTGFFANKVDTIGFYVNGGPQWAFKADYGGSSVPSVYLGNTNKVAGNNLGVVEFYGRTTNDALAKYADIVGQISAPTNAAQVGKVTIRCMAAGVLTDVVTFSGAGAIYSGSGASLELGAPGSANTPFLDFHSSGGSARDYDVRLIASGGSTSVDGQGTLSLYGVLNLQNPATTTTAPAAGGAGALPATPLGYVTIQIAGVARKVAYYA